MATWFNKQSRLVQILLLLIPFVNWMYGALHLGGGSVELIRDAGIQLLGDGVDDIGIVYRHLNRLAEEYSTLSCPGWTAMKCWAGLRSSLLRASPK